LISWSFKSSSPGSESLPPESSSSSFLDYFRSHNKSLRFHLPFYSSRSIIDDYSLLILDEGLERPEYSSGLIKDVVCLNFFLFLFTFYLSLFNFIPAD